MGRAGRYTLSVMAWVAAYAGWSSLIGLVVAAVTGDHPRTLSAGASALFTVVGPLVPTLVALWFNDWARDGFPTRDQRRAGRSGPGDGPGPSHPLAPLRSSSRGYDGPDPSSPRDSALPDPVSDPAVDAPAAASSAAAPGRADSPAAPAPLADSPAAPAAPAVAAPGPAVTAFPVAPLVRD
jgi:hypothetical protein